MHWGCARFDSLVVEFQGGVFLRQFGTDTQVVCFCASLAQTPRPIGCGLEHGQCGVGICGYAGGLAHTPVFGVLTSHGGEAVAVFNLDLNCCPSLEC